MKKIFYLLFAGILIFSCSHQTKDVQITVENPSDFDRTEELVEIPIESITAQVKLPDTTQTYIVKDSKGEVIPTQITYDGKLVFQSGVKAKESITFTITTGAKEEYKSKTYGRLITERKDDFAWENDRVAFRIYGPALIATDGPSNGLDIWYKRTNALKIGQWYKDDIAGVSSYHDDHGEGLDDYKVGRSLGAGAMAPFVDGKLVLNENFVTSEVLENGPLRTTFKLTYKDIEINGKSYKETRTFSLYAGSQLSKVVQEYGVSESIDVAAGFSKREKNDTIIVSPEKDYLIYREPSEKAGNVFLGLVFPAGFDSTAVDTYSVVNPVNNTKGTYTHVLAIAKYQPNSPITYYTGYGWTKFGFASEADFQTYLTNFSNTLKQPLIIKF